MLYHMMMLRPPFDGTNPLSVASKIVEGSYDPVRVLVMYRINCLECTDMEEEAGGWETWHQSLIGDESSASVRLGRRSAEHLLNACINMIVAAMTVNMAYAARSYICPSLRDYEWTMLLALDCMHKHG